MRRGQQGRVAVLLALCAMPSLATAVDAWTTATRAMRAGTATALRSFLSVGTASARLALHQQTLTQGCWRSTQLQWGWCMAGCVCTVPKASLAREGEWSWPAAALWHPKAHRVQAGPWAHTPADPSINRGEAKRGSSATCCPDGPTNAVESILDGDETRASTRRLCYRH
jgi:hypothetical protein